MAEERKTESVFDSLYHVDVRGKTEQKNGLTYLSWSWAWAEIKKRYPDAAYTIYENVDGWNYFTDGRTCWVKTGMTINGLEHIEYLPVMDFKNRSIPLESVTSFDVNKAIQRSLTKAAARHGLGLFLYTKDGIPEERELPAEEMVKNITKALSDAGTSMEGFLNYCHLSKIEDITPAIYNEWMPKLINTGKSKANRKPKKAEDKS